MGWIDVELGRIASGQNRVVTTDQLLDRGISRRQVHWLVKSGRINQVHKGVHLVGAEPVTFLEQATAVCLSRPDAVLSHSSAGYLYGIRKSASERLEITIPTGTGCELPRVKVHRSNRLDHEDVLHRLDGIRLTSPERLLFDQAGILDQRELFSAAHDAIHRELVSAQSLNELGDRMITRGRRGAADFGRLLSELEGEVRPAESDGELLLAAAARAAGLDPVPQYWVSLATGARVRVDLALPDVRLAIEFDHSFWHAIPSRVQADKARDVQLQRIGWRVLRFTELDLQKPGAVARAIADVVRQLRLAAA